MYSNRLGGFRNSKPRNAKPSPTVVSRLFSWFTTNRRAQTGFGGAPTLAGPLIPCAPAAPYRPRNGRARQNDSSCRHRDTTADTAQIALVLLGPKAPVITSLDQLRRDPHLLA